MEPPSADLDAAGLHRRDRRPVETRPGAIFCFVCGRDEALRLPHFLDHHRALGVDRFFVVDNLSADGSLELLLGEEDVHVFSAPGSYAQSACGVAWLNALLAHYGRGHWCLTLDADELFVYPGCEDLDLRGLVRFLDAEGSDAVATFLLDMYADRPLRETVYRQGEPFLSLCPWFDVDTYHERDDRGLPVRGGPRHRLFWEGRARAKPSPVLRKLPLVKWRDGLAYSASTHLVDGELTLSSLTGVLMHFKFFADFCERMSAEVARGEQFDGASQCASYLDVLTQTPELNPRCAASRRYESSAQLVQLGLMRAPAGFPRPPTTRCARAAATAAAAPRRVRLVMTLLVRDEEDVLAANIDYHLAQGVDFFIVTDHRSADGTAGILKGYERRGLLRYIFEPSESYEQHAWVTRMARAAATEHGADWVINSDADEFWWPRSGSLADTFAALPDEVSLVEAPRRNFAAVAAGPERFYDRMVYRERTAFNPLGRPLLPKVAHRARADVAVAQGNHAVEGFEAPQTAAGAVEILHFPTRSYAQIENKIVKGGAAYERSARLPEWMGETWRKLYADYRRDGDLRSYYGTCCYDGLRLADALLSGELVVDRRLAEHFAARRDGR